MRRISALRALAHEWECPLTCAIVNYHGIARREKPRGQAAPHCTHAEKAELREVFASRVDCVICHVTISSAFRH
jgi:hypothetical protein